MPMYVGKGQIAKRVKGHARPGSSKTRYWDHFSWFVIDNSRFESQLEIILLRSLPYYVRSLNRQTGSLGRKTESSRYPNVDQIGSNFLDWVIRKNTRKRGNSNKDFFRAGF
jgi:hypothetical protein